MTSSSHSRIGALLKEKAIIRLDIGCGASKQGRDWVGMDIRPGPGVDIVHDWNDYPWPLPDESVTVAVASHVVEHVNPADGGFLRWMDELWRVMRVDGQVAIVTPHGSSQGYLQDPTHCNPCNEWTWAYFDPLETQIHGAYYRIYRPKPWRIEGRVMFDPTGSIEVVLAKRRDDRSYYAE